MAEPDTFDPTHALDGWRPPAPAPLQDLDIGSLLEAGSLRLGSTGARLIRAQPDAFDPTRLLDGWRPPTPAPLDLELRSLLRAGTVPDEAKMARLKKRGYEMRDVEDIELAEARAPRVVPEVKVQDIPPPLAEAEASWPLFVEEAQVLDGGTVPPVAPGPAKFLDGIQLPPVPPAPVAAESPVLDFPVGPPPSAPDPQQVIEGIELPQVAPPPVVIDMPELDIAALAPRPPPPDARLLVRWQAQAWTALARQVAGASAELSQAPQGPQVQNHAPQWLCALWTPQPEEAPLGRWPELAALVAAETRAEALQQLLAELPGDAPLWSADLEADWDLVAELVLHQDTQLRPSQARALRELAETERQAKLTRLDEAYALQGRVARRRA